MTDSQQEIARDVAAVARISAVPALLRLICQNTGMGFAAVARVTDGSWTACAVQDDIAFGLLPGGQLPVETTLCRESRAARLPVVFDHASQDPLYRDHHTPRLYKIESYISVPIVLPDGQYFGNLCAIDPRPRKVSDERTLAMFTAFAQLIASQLDSEDRQRAFESALADERAVSELREQFIAVLGHDLRNPLAVVGATAQLMLRRRAEDLDLLRMGHGLQAATRRMSRLIDDVLDFARGRLGSGMGLALADEPDLGAALREVLAEARTAHPQGVFIDDIRIDVPARCDRTRLQQLLSNLVGNAIAHGAPGRPIRVSASVEEGGLRLSVANEGEPIAAEYLPKVFEPYWRPATSTPGGGLGLGLYICAQIAKAHGGSMQVRSSAAEGTCFEAWLPVGTAR